MNLVYHPFDINDYWGSVHCSTLYIRLGIQRLSAGTYYIYSKVIIANLGRAVPFWVRRNLDGVSIFLQTVESSMLGYLLRLLTFFVKLFITAVCKLAAL